MTTSCDDQARLHVSVSLNLKIEQCESQLPTIVSWTRSAQLLGREYTRTC